MELSNSQSDDTSNIQGLLVDDDQSTEDEMEDDSLNRFVLSEEFADNTTIV